MVGKIMYMLAYRYIIAIAILLSACAQVGSISGGPKDVTPPRIVSCTPNDGQKLVSAKGMKIEFDEFVKLQKPNDNIILLPANIDYEYELKGKTLEINFQEPLKANTTYSLYLNAAIQDITEGNDSLIQVAFSTGNEIDDNEAHFMIFDAYTRKPKKNVLIGLYDSLVQEEPTYFSKTDDKGYAKLRALREGKFFYKVFVDENKNRIKENDEVQFASTQAVLLDSAYSDTLKLFISKPKVKLYSIDASFITPYILEVAIPNDYSFQELKFNGIQPIILDSLPEEANKLRYILPKYVEDLELELDTLNKKVRNEKDIEELTLIENIKKLKLFPNDFSINLEFNSPIASLRGEKGDFSLMNVKDSTVIQLDSSQIRFKQNRIELNLNNQTFKRALLQIDSAAFCAQNNICNHQMNMILEQKVSEDLAVLNVKVDTDMDSWYIELLKNDQAILLKGLFSDSNSILFQDLEPGSYTLSIVEDINKNKRWDSFSPFDYSGPEQRFTLEKRIKVKANWEHEVEFKVP